MTLVYSQWDRWTSYDLTKHRMINTKGDHQNSSKDSDTSALLRT